MDPLELDVLWDCELPDVSAETGLCSPTRAV